MSQKHSFMESRPAQFLHRSTTLSGKLTYFFKQAKRTNPMRYPTRTVAFQGNLKKHPFWISHQFHFPKSFLMNARQCSGTGKCGCLAYYLNVLLTMYRAARESSSQYNMSAKSNIIMIVVLKIQIFSIDHQINNCFPKPIFSLFCRIIRSFAQEGLLHIIQVINSRFVLDENQSSKFISAYLFLSYLLIIIHLLWRGRMEADVTAEQILELRHKTQIQSVNPIKRNQYHIVYSPKVANTPYSNLIYHIKLIIPDKYPQVPPKLLFLDKIYHLNIETASGAVSMPILSDDWSPYLTLSAIFDSLDSLLQEPDVNYAASPYLKEEYTNEPEMYIQKVEQFLKAANEIKQEMGSVIEHVEVINDSKYNDGLNNEEMPEFLNHELHPNFQSGQALFEIPRIKQINTMSSQNQRPEEIIVQTERDLSGKGSAKNQGTHRPIQLLPKKFLQSPRGNGSKKMRQSIKKGKNDKESEKIQRVSRQIENLKQSNDQALRSENQFSKMELNLKQTDGLVSILLAQSNSMEECLKKSQNSRVRALLQQKQQRIIQMLEQTLELSSQLREKLFLTLKNSAKCWLK